MSKKGTTLAVRGGTDATGRWAKYVFAGGVVGFVVGIGAVYVFAERYGAAIGLSPTDCVALGCTVALFLSQPAGLGGMLVGALVGAALGGIVYYARHLARPT
jgi:hypothetical protein